MSKRKDEKRRPSVDVARPEVEVRKDSSSFGLAGFVFLVLALSWLFLNYGV